MLVKIVILNWNGAEHLRRFLPSVVTAAPDGMEIIVADNGSTDDSVAVLNADFPSVRVIRLDANYGFAEGYNRALAQLKADCFVLLNSDVETPAGWLEPLIAALENDPGVAAVAPKLRALTAPAKFEYAGAAGGYIDYLGYPFCRGRILRCMETDNGQYDDARDVFGSAARRSVVGPMFSGNWVVSMLVSLPTWRKSIFAGGCSWPVIGFVSCPKALFTTSVAGHSRPIRLRKYISTIGIIWRCCSNARRPCSAAWSLPCALCSICWRPVPICCRAMQPVSVPCSALIVISCVGMAN